MTTTLIQRTIGPRVPATEIERHGLRYGLPNLMLGVARVLLLVSLFLPYWRMTLEAPQYPDGLHVTAYVNHLEGDVAEIDGLNHYIGMRPLGEAAQFERAASVWIIIAMVLLVEGAAFVHNRWAAVLALPAILFVPFFLLDLAYWLRTFGQNLDPAAPLSSAVKPFTPPVLGVGTVGQFRTIASAGEGLYVAGAAAAVVVLALYFHRRAYKPLVERMGAAAS
ncbi:MAG: hypothetical protein KDA22_01470 [Phycisphaerales bacterium]|nr:hypothetical protein [Phycisphaerales bacterium]